MAESYQVIARRWRPKRFSELVGQEHIVQTLSHAIERKRIAHAYLFIGPRGTGKTTTARLLAMSLNCEDGPSISPDPDSPICQSIIQGSCLDVIEIDGASNNSVDQVRALREECQYAPGQCRYKVYIIDEVHMLSIAAFNALLKTLEEPPAHVKFIFATTESQKVPATIASRCQRLEFRPISEETIRGKLRHIIQAEGVQVEEAALASIARLANGGMRDAQSILDQMLAFCGHSLTERDVLEVYGLASEAQLQGLLQSMLQADYSQLLQASEAVVQQGCDLSRALLDLKAILQQKLIQSALQGQDNEADMPSMEALVRMLDALQEAEPYVRNGLSDKDHFLLALLKATEQSRTRAIDSLLKTLKKLSAQNLPSEVKKKIEALRDTLPQATPQAVVCEQVVESPQPEVPETAQDDGPSLSPHLRNLLEEEYAARYVGVRTIPLKRLI